VFKQGDNMLSKPLSSTGQNDNHLQTSLLASDSFYCQYYLSPFGTSQASCERPARHFSVAIDWA
jgi:hypothetical protein